MSYLVVDRNYNELIFNDKPKYDRFTDSWLIIKNDVYIKIKRNNGGIDSVFDEYGYEKYVDYGIKLPCGTIEKLTGKKINIGDEPIKLL